MGWKVFRAELIYLLYSGVAANRQPQSYSDMAPIINLISNNFWQQVNTSRCSQLFPPTNYIQYRWANTLFKIWILWKIIVWSQSRQANISGDVSAPLRQANPDVLHLQALLQLGQELPRALHHGARREPQPWGEGALHVSVGPDLSHPPVCGPGQVITIVT